MSSQTTSAEVITTVSRKLPGEEGIWVLIVGDMFIFSMFFFVFSYYQSANVDMYAQSRALLNQTYGAINTLLLLTSSLFVALSLNAVREQLMRRATYYLKAGMLCGLGFVFIKFLEYGEKFGNDITILTNEFFMYYFIFTFIHFIHVCLGMTFLYYLLQKTSKQQSFDNKEIQTYECGAAFWHLVDLLWIVLFPLLYLMRVGG